MNTPKGLHIAREAAKLTNCNKRKNGRPSVGHYLGKGKVIGSEKGDKEVMKGEA